MVEVDMSIKIFAPILINKKQYGLGTRENKRKKQKKRPKSKRKKIEKKVWHAGTCVQHCLTRHAPVCHESREGARPSLYCAPSLGHDTCHTVSYGTGQHFKPLRKTSSRSLTSCDSISIKLLSDYFPINTNPLER